jgi:hypothetical protein
VDYLISKEIRRIGNWTRMLYVVAYSNECTKGQSHKIAHQRIFLFYN